MDDEVLSQRKLRPLHKIWNQTIHFGPKLTQLQLSGTPTYSSCESHKLLGLLHRTLTLNLSRLNPFNAQIRPVVEYCFIACSNMRQCDRLVIESVHRAFMKWLTGISPNPSFMKLCTVLNLEPLWLWSATESLLFFNNIVVCNICI